MRAFFWGVTLAADGTAPNIGPEQKVKTQIFEACKATITNILYDLHGIENLYPALHDISFSNIVTVEAYDPITQKPNRVHHRLQYRKNARNVKLTPDEKGRAPQWDQGTFVGDGGIALDIYIVDRPLLIPGSEFLLPVGQGDDQMRLIYDLGENPPDRSLEQAVNGIITNQVNVLSNALVVVQSKASAGPK